MSVCACSSSHGDEDVGAVTEDAPLPPSDAGPPDLACPDWFPHEYFATVSVECRPEGGAGFLIVATPEPHMCDDRTTEPRLEMLGFHLPSEDIPAWYTERATGRFEVCAGGECLEVGARWSFDDESAGGPGTGFSVVCRSGASGYGSSTSETTVWCGPREITCP